MAQLVVPVPSRAQAPLDKTAVKMLGELPEEPQAQSALNGATGQQNTAAKSKTDSQPGTGQAEIALSGGATDAPDAQPAHISGTVTDVDGDLIPGADVVVEGPDREDRHTTVANDNGMFSFDDLKPGIPYQVKISANGFVDWTSSVTLSPGQFYLLTGSALPIAGGVTSVTVTVSREEIALEQVKIEEHQRVLGFIPNFYVVYDRNPVPLTTKLKFELAMKVSLDPVTWGGVAFMAGIDQAANTPDFVQGMKGYGQRVGAIAADGLSDILIGGAILPSLLHQDPRYYYQGTGTTKSRTIHALSFPFICKGDNGRWQPNYSSLGGNLASSALSNAYYPDSNRGVGLMFGGFAIGTAERMVSALAQEFILRRLTPAAKNQH